MILINNSKSKFTATSAKSPATKTLGPRTFLHRFNTSGGKISSTLKKFMIFISSSREHEKIAKIIITYKNSYSC